MPNRKAVAMRYYRSKASLEALIRSHPEPFRRRDEVIRMVEEKHGVSVLGRLVALSEKRIQLKPLRSAGTKRLWIDSNAMRFLLRSQAVEDSMVATREVLVFSKRKEGRIVEVVAINWDHVPVAV